MKQIQTIEKGANFSAANFGKLSDIKDYVLELGPEIKIPGKVFGGQAVGARVASSLSRYSLPVRKQASFTLTRIMRNSTSSSRAKESFRLTATSSLLRRALLSA